MNDSVTKDDLRQFGLLLLNDIRKIIDESQTSEKESLDPEWLKRDRKSVV